MRVFSKLLLIFMALTQFIPPYLPVQAANCSLAFGIAQPNVPSDPSAMSAVESQLGRPINIVHWYQHWGEGADVAKLEATSSKGAIPMISWASMSVNIPDISAGTQDPYIDSWVQTLSEYKRPVFLIPLEGMDDPGNGYGLGVNTAANLKGAWQHIWTRFSANNTSNVFFVWQPVGNTHASEVYPGDKFVDWMGLTAINRGSPWTSLESNLSIAYSSLTSTSSSKPMIITSFGSVEGGGNKAQWISDGTNSLTTKFPRIQAAIYLNSVDPAYAGQNFSFNSSPASLNAAKLNFGPGGPFCLDVLPILASQHPTAIRPSPSPTSQITPRPTIRFSPTPSSAPTFSTHDPVATILSQLGIFFRSSYIIAPIGGILVGILLYAIYKYLAYRRMNS